MYKVRIEFTDDGILAVKINDSFNVGKNYYIVRLDNIEFECFLLGMIKFNVRINQNWIMICELSMGNHEFTLNETCSEIIGLKYDKLILKYYNERHCEEKIIKIPCRTILGISKNVYYLIYLCNSKLGISRLIFRCYETDIMFGCESHPLKFTQHPDNIKILIDVDETKYIIDKYIDKKVLHTKPAKREENI
jgi:hypothetical protein